MIVARPLCLGGGWLGRARSSRNGRLSTSVHSGLDVPSGIRRTAIRTMRFLEWIGVPQSASLLEISGGRWLDNLSRDHSMTAAVHLQRDVRLMQTNLDVLNQYTLSLQGTASKMIELCLGTRDFPVEEVAAVPLVLVSNALPCRWRRWGCGGHPWIRCGSISRLNYIGLVSCWTVYL